MFKAAVLTVSDRSFRESALTRAGLWLWKF